MLALLILTGVLGQSAGPAPDVAVKAIDDSRLRVWVRPLDVRTIKAIALERPAKKTKPSLHIPHTRVTLNGSEGICFTFSPISEPFDVIVTLSDDSVYRIGKNAWRDPNSMRTQIMIVHRHPPPTCF